MFWNFVSLKVSEGICHYLNALNGCLRYHRVYGDSQQAVMAASREKRLPGLCGTYRAEFKDNIELFVELKDMICI